MSDEPMTSAPITQADRDAAERFTNDTDTPILFKLLAQAFADHRLASVPASGEVGELIERLRAEKTAIGKRPTIAELETILAQPDQAAVRIMPDGSISAGGNLVNPDGPEAADTLLRLQTELSAAQAREARMRGLLEEAWHFVKAIEEYEGQRHTKRWEQSLDLRKRIDAALKSKPDAAVGGEGDTP